MKLLLITDSLGYPRETPEKVQFSETWCSLLRKRCTTYQFSLGGARITDLLRQTSYLKLFNPDRVVVQAGIVDCAPRALTARENSLINRNRFFKRIMRILLKGKLKRLRKRGITYTSENVFRKNVLQFNNLFGDTLYWVGILPASPEYEDKVPGITRNIEQYNRIIRDCLKERYIDVAEINSGLLMSDQHHLNVSGHAYLADKVVDTIFKST